MRQTAPLRVQICRILAPNSACKVHTKKIPRFILWVNLFAFCLCRHHQKSSPGITLINLMYNFSILSVYAYIFYENIYLEFYDKFREVTNSVLFMYLSKMQVLANLLLGFTNIVLMMKHHTILWRILDKFDEINSVMQEHFGSIEKYGIIKKINYLTVTVTYGILITLLTISWVYYEKILKISSYIVYISQYLGNLPTLCLFSQCILCNFYVKRRFGVINKFLAQMIIPENPQKNLSSTPNFTENLTVFEKDFPLKLKRKKKHKSPKIFWVTPNNQVLTENLYNLDTSILIEKISVLAKVHDSLCDCTELINRVFSVPVLLALSTIYSFNLIGYFSCYRAFFDEHQEVSIVTAITNVLWISYYTSISIMNIYVSHSMTKTVS